jgi:hypothetical protein
MLLYTIVTFYEAYTHFAQIFFHVGDKKLHLDKSKDAYVCLNLEFDIIQNRHICFHS